MRSPTTRSTVPTWTPSAPMTSIPASILCFIMASSFVEIIHTPATPWGFSRRFELIHIRRQWSLAVESEASLGRGDFHWRTVTHVAGKDHFGERILHVALDHTLERARAIGWIP